jgi:hypothetical protein
MSRSTARRVVLLCRECEERMVLDDPGSVWRSGYTFFECECGNNLTLADRFDEYGTKSQLVSSQGHLAGDR